MQAVTAILRLAYLFFLVAILLPFGSVAPLPLHVLSTGMLTVTALALLIMPLAANTRWLVVATIIMAAFLMGWIFIQSTAILGSSAIWGAAGDILNATLPATLSIQPDDTLAAMIQCLLPFATFIAGLVLFSGDRSALLLLQFIVASGIVFAVIGLGQFVVFPEMLLLSEKIYYRDSLTLMFVNRNTAATYLGLLLVLGSAMVFGPARTLIGRARTALMSNSSLNLGSEAIRFLPALFGLTIVIGALMLTQSRAGIASTLAGLVVTTAILMFQDNPDVSRRRGTRLKRSWFAIGPIARLSLAVLFVGGLGLILAGRALLRAQIYGGEDARFCMLPRVIKLLNDNWLLGTGLSTFRQAFASYRDVECGIYGVWDMAHNFYLEGWITLGLPFVLACALTVVTLVACFVVGVVRRRRLRWVAVAGIGMLLLTLGHSAIDFSLQIPGFSVIFGAVMAACATISLHNPAQPLAADRSSPQPA